MMFSSFETKESLAQAASTIKSSIQSSLNANVFGERDPEIQKIRKDLADLTDLVEAICRHLPEDQSGR